MNQIKALLKHLNPQKGIPNEFSTFSAKLDWHLQVRMENEILVPVDLALNAEVDNLLWVVIQELKGKILKEA